MGIEILDNENYSEVSPVPNLDIPELEEVACVTPTEEPDSKYIIYCRPKKPYRGGCPECGSLNYYGHGKAANRLVHDISKGLSSVFLEVQVPRYKCNDCGKTFNYIFDEIRKNEKFTERLYIQIKKRALNESFSRIASEYELSVSTVKQMMMERGEELEERRGPVVAPRILGIDEKHIEHKMRGVFVDIEAGELLEMTENNKRQTVIDTIYKMKGYDKIEIVTMDMANAYRPAIEEALPWAKIIVDKFHVLSDLFRYVQTSKVAITNKLKEDIAKMPDGKDKDEKNRLITELGKNNRLFKYSIENLGKNKAKASLMAKLTEEFEELNQLRLLKEGLERMYKADDRKEAEKRYDMWVSIVKSVKGNELFSGFQSIYRTTQNWFEEIMGYFDDGCRVTNATTEGLNSLIQDINELGNGYGFETLRYKCLFYEPAEIKPKSFKQTKRIFAETKDKDDKGKHTFGFGTPGGLRIPTKTVTETVTIDNPQGSKIDVLLKALEEGNLI